MSYVPLGRYAGVPARAHWSLLVILALISQLLAVQILPSALPDRQPAAYWLVGIAAGVTFLAAVLAHELAHAFAARRYGLPVDHVTLWMLGGVTELRREPPTPRADAVVAASGPATSLLLGGVFAGLAWLFPGAGLVTIALAWLAGVNLILGVFNLLPGAPLDGGRVLRAALWHRHRDWSRAAEASARVGSLLGVALIAFGLLQLLAGAVLGLWLAVIGWFMMSAAATERQAAAGKRLGNRVVRDIMRTPPETAPSWWTVADFVRQLGVGYAGQPRFVLVDFDGRPSAVLSLGEIARVRVDERDTVRLRDIARRWPPLLVLEPDARLADIAQRLAVHGGIAAVVEDGRVVGTLRQDELLAAMTLAALQPPVVEKPATATEASQPDHRMHQEYR